MKLFSLFFVFFILFCVSVFAQNAYNVTLLDSFKASDNLNPWSSDDRCSGIWGWTDQQSGNDFALMGLFYRGLGIFDVTDSYDIEMVGDTLPGEGTHEVKTYENYAYTANKETRHHDSTDIRIIRLDLAQPAVVGRIPVGFSPGHDITRVHDLDISDGVLFLACENNVYDSTRHPNMFFYDLQQNPAAPTRIGSWTIPESIAGSQSYYMMLRDGDPGSLLQTEYPWVVEVYVKDNRIYAACAGSGIIVATFEKYTDQYGQLHLDVDENQTWQLTYRNVRRTTGTPPDDYRVTHTVKVTDDHQYVFVCDEVLRPDPENQNEGGVLRMFDISNIESLPPISQQAPSAFVEPLVLYESPENPDDGRVVYSDNDLIYPNDPPNSIHKVFLKEDFAFISYYTKGIRVLDISDPLHWKEAGYFDTPAVNPDPIHSLYAGSWGVYPFLPSGNILVADHDGLRTFKFGESGAITQNTTWSGTKYVLGDVTVNNGVTLTIQSGTTVRFAQNTQLIVNGKLLAQGSDSSPITFTAIKPSSKWEGIRFYDSADDNSIISHAVIENAEYGVYCYRASPTIQNCSIQNNSVFGINTTYSSDPDIISNSITGNQYGIRTFSASGYINDNHIFANSIRGVVIDESSTPDLFNNTIENNGGYGVDCQWYSAPNFGSPGGPGGYNVIRNQPGGLFAAFHTAPFLGNGNGGGYNSLYGNSNFNAHAEEGTQMDAKYNWWGQSPPDESLITFDGWTSIIYYEPYLTSDPGGGSSLASPQMLAEFDDSESNYSSASEISGAMETTLAWDTTTAQGLWNFAQSLWLAGNTVEAREAFKSLALRHPDSQYGPLALVKLSELENGAATTDLVQFLENLLSRNDGVQKIHWTALDLLIPAYLDQGMDKEAIYASQEIIQGTPVKGRELRALYHLFNIYLYEQNLTTQAAGILNTLEKKYPDAMYTHLAQIEIGAASNGEAASPQNALANAERPQKKKLATVENIPSEFTLKPNYPNPFNPATTIAFDLPEESNILLEIFDLNGRKIRTLTNTHYNAGRHQVMWNGTDDRGRQVASGLYMYRLTAGDFVQSHKMLLMK